MFKKVEYYCVGELGNKEVRVPFSGTVYTDCQKCGNAIEFDVHELASFENDTDEGFTEFGAFTCHECLQEQGQATEPVKTGVTVSDVLNTLEEFESLSEKNMGTIAWLLSEAFEMDNEDGFYIKLEKAVSYAEALCDNGLMDDTEYDVLSVAIGAVQYDEGE